MTNKLLEDFDELTAADRTLLSSKNEDYGADSDPYKNFRLCELMGTSTVEQGIYLRMLDKISRLSKAINGTNYLVQDERVEDTLRDLRNYSVILQSYIKNKKHVDNQ